MKHELASRGVAASDVDSMLKEVHIKTVPIQKGKETGSVNGLEWLSSFLLAMMLYLTLIVYGMSVMRSVLEEKTSRVMEVMLSCVTPKELMAGKIVGVGAAGLTQIAIWCAVAGVFGGAGAAASGNGPQLGITAGTLVALVPFFLAGFLLYSGLYAALGATLGADETPEKLACVGAKKKRMKITSTPQPRVSADPSKETMALNVTPMERFMSGSF